MGAAAAVECSCRTKWLALAGHSVLVLCCFIFLFCHCLHRAGVGLMCCTCRTNQRYLGWKQVKKRWGDSDLSFRDLG